MTIEEQIEFLRKRALVERQIGTNQCLTKNTAGFLRLERANNYDLCADSLAKYEGELRAFKSEIVTLKDELKKER